MDITLEEPVGLRRRLSAALLRNRNMTRHAQTSKAPVTDSSHRSNMNSSSAMDSLSTLMIRWHNCGTAQGASVRSNAEQDGVRVD